jgi:hypothetical protein
VRASATRMCVSARRRRLTAQSGEAGTEHDSGVKASLRAVFTDYSGSTAREHVEVVMAGGYVSGWCTLRPMRVGLLVEPGDWDSLKTAVAWATSAWGGQGFPIFVTGDDDRTLREAVALGVDVLIPVARDADALRLARSPGFDWRTLLNDRSPFLRDDSGIGEHALPASALYAWIGAHRPEPESCLYLTWDQDHPLARVLAAWFGEFGHDTPRQHDREHWERVARHVHLAENSPIPEHGNLEVNQLSATLEEVELEPRIVQHGFAVIDPTSFEDVVAFWNLRACGNDVVPWVEEHAALLEPLLSTALERLSAEPSAAGRRPRATIWNRAPGAVPGRLADHLGDRIEAWSSDLGLDFACFGPMSTKIRRMFRADVDPERGSASITLPQLDFLPRRSSSSDLGLVSAMIDITTESGLPGDCRFTAPAARCVAPLLRRFDQPFIRLRDRGWVVPVRATDESVHLPLVYSEPLVTALLKTAGLAPHLGENGRRTEHRIKLLGGPREDSLANQPAVRETVRKALRCRNGVNSEALYGHAARFAGTWSHLAPHWSGPYRDYPSAVIGELGRRGVLRPHAVIKCLRCGSAIRIGPERLGDAVVCELCSASFPLAVYIANAPARALGWEMAATSAFDATEFNSTLPVMAALSVLTSVFEQGSGNPLPLAQVGMEIECDGLEGDLDFVVLAQDAELPVVIIGEAKAGKPEKPNPGELFSADNLALLEAAQDAIRATGIDCWIAFATTRPTLEPAEVQLLRRACERPLEPVHDFHGTILPVLPIILTDGALSVPSMNENHPTRYAHDFPHLPALGRKSCERELGLVDLDYAMKNDAWVTRPRWRDDGDSRSESDVPA